MEAFLIEALKALRPGRVAPYTLITWPEPGTWLEADGPIDLCRSGVHALLPEALPMWIAEELWRVELDGAENVAPGIVAGERGRLISRIEEWNDATARDFALACAQRLEGFTGRAAERAAMVRTSAPEAVAGASTTTVTYMAAHAAEDAAPGGYEAERRWQAQWLAEHLGLSL